MGISQKINNFGFLKYLVKRQLLLREALSLRNKEVPLIFLQSFYHTGGISVNLQ